MRPLTGGEWALSVVVRCGNRVQLKHSRRGRGHWDSGEATLTFVVGLELGPFKSETTIHRIMNHNVYKNSITKFKPIINIYRKHVV